MCLCVSAHTHDTQLLTINGFVQFKKNETWNQSACITPSHHRIDKKRAPEMHSSLCRCFHLIWLAFNFAEKRRLIFENELRQHKNPKMC